MNRYLERQNKEGSQNNNNNNENEKKKNVHNRQSNVEENYKLFMNIMDHGGRKKRKKKCRFFPSNSQLINE